MADEIQMKSPYADPEFTGIGEENYLGSPAVVGRLVSTFCYQAEQILVAKGSGVITADQCAAQFVALCREYGGIFSGEDPEYKTIIGFHGANRSLWIRSQVELGEFWREHKDTFGENPVSVMFYWLFLWVLDAFNKADGDDMLLGVMLSPRIEQMNERLLGIEERA